MNYADYFSFSTFLKTKKKEKLENKMKEHYNTLNLKEIFEDFLSQKGFEFYQEKINKKTWRAYKSIFVKKYNLSKKQTEEYLLNHLRLPLDVVVNEVNKKAGRKTQNGFKMSVKTPLIEKIKFSEKDFVCLLNDIQDNKLPLVNKFKIREALTQNQNLKNKLAEYISKQNNSKELAIVVDNFLK